MPTTWSKLRWTVLEEHGGHVEIMLNSESRRSNKRMIAEDSFDDTLHLCDMIEFARKNVIHFLLTLLLVITVCSEIFSLLTVWISKVVPFEALAVL